MADVPGEKPMGGEGYGGFNPPEYDVENGGTKERKMSRIDKPSARPIYGGDDSDTASTISVGKQMEMEAGNAIKYRTCSWQKVNPGPAFPCAQIMRRCPVPFTSYPMASGSNKLIISFIADLPMESA